MLKVRPKPHVEPPRFKLFFGVDVALTNIGLACVDNMGKVMLATTIKPWSKTTVDCVRIDQLTEQFFDAINPLIGEHCQSSAYVKFMFEAYAFGKASGKSFSRAELAGVLKYQLRQGDYDILACSPTSLKKHACGKGGGGKDAVLQGVFRKYGHYTQDNNEADAVAAAFYGHDIFINHAPLDITRHNVFRPEFR